MPLSRILLFAFAAAAGRMVFAKIKAGGEA